MIEPNTRVPVTTEERHVNAKSDEPHTPAPDRGGEVIGDEELAKVKHRYADRKNAWVRAGGWGEGAADTILRLIARLDAAESRLAAAEDVVGAADDLAMRWAFRGQAAFADFFSDGMDKLADALGRYDSTPPTTTDHPPTSEGPT